MLNCASVKLDIAAKKLKYRLVDLIVWEPIIEKYIVGLINSHIPKYNQSNLKLKSAYPEVIFAPKWGSVAPHILEPHLEN